MTPLQLAQAGRALYGEEWKPAFCGRFNINPRTLRHMLADTQDIPAGLARDISAAIDAEIQTLQGARP